MVYGAAGLMYFLKTGHENDFRIVSEKIEQQVWSGGKGVGCEGVNIDESDV